MEVTLTSAQLVAAFEALQRLARVRLNAKTRYHVAKLVTLLAPDVQHFVSEQNALVRELGTSREPNGVERAQFGPGPIYEVLPSGPTWLEFERRLRELREVPVRVAWAPLTSAMFANVDEVTAADLLSLGPLCELVEPTEEATQ